MLEQVLEHLVNGSREMKADLLEHIIDGKNVQFVNKVQVTIQLLA